VARLSAAVDRADEAAIVACYTEDSYDDHGSFKGSGAAFAAMICSPSSPTRRMVMHHLLGQSVFDIEADDAWGETFFVMHAVIEDRTTTGFGRYIDYFRRTDEGWKVGYRRVVPDKTLPGDSADAYWQPSSGRDDPRYDRLTTPPGER
jgi:hypothetical protein